MNAMKNIKKPAYAVELGQGLFKGYDDDEFATVWVCVRCNKKVKSNGKPPAGNDCQVAYSGHHEWTQFD